MDFKVVKKSYNKIIELELISRTKTIRIASPLWGRKPNINITGTFTSQDNITIFEVRIYNLYLDVDYSEVHSLVVTCGYAGEKQTAIVGAISAMYTDSPGPDRVTVIQCTNADVGKWLTKACDISVEKGESFKTVLETISKDIGFNPPKINKVDKTLESPFEHNGLVKDAVHKLRDLFPSVFIRIDSNFFSASEKSGSGTKYQIRYLSSAPQFSGASVSFTSPWIPALRPEDTVQLSTSYYVQDITSMTLDKKSEFKVTSVSFEFSTIDGTNSMTVTAVTQEATK